MVIFISQRYHCEILHTVSKLIYIYSYFMKPNSSLPSLTILSSLCVLLHGCVSLSAVSRLVYRLPNAESWREAQRNWGPRARTWIPAKPGPARGRKGNALHGAPGKHRTPKASKQVCELEPRQLTGEVWGTSPGVPGARLPAPHTR